MPYLQYRDQRVVLTQADQVIGAFDGAALRIPGDDPGARAVVRVAPDGTGVIARASTEAVVFVNGLQLGAEPSPLLHGDKVELGGCQLQYGDDTKGGSTQFISAASLAAHVKAAGTPRKPTSATGGRLISLVDGREYQVPDAGVTLGREIGNDIVVASGDVSRRHARIAPDDEGYVLTDMSTNGVLVNGVRVEGSQILGRGDVIRIGAEEFRFYADKARESEASAPSAVAQAAPAPAAPVAPAVPAAPAVVAGPAAPAVPAVRAEPISEAPTEPKPVDSGRSALASLEVMNEGPMKGRRFEIFTPLTNVGRGAHNDIAIADDSISDSHAKIVFKDGRWYVMDQGSTNGTYVGGHRIVDEQQLVGAPDVRFGNVKLMFRPLAGAGEAGGSTRAIASISPEQARRLSAHQRPGLAAAEPGPAVAHPAHKAEKPIVIPEVSVPAKKKGCAAMIVFAIAAGTAAGGGLLAILMSVGG